MGLFFAYNVHVLRNFAQRALSGTLVPLILAVSSKRHINSWYLDTVVHKHAIHVTSAPLLLRYSLLVSLDPIHVYPPLRTRLLHAFTPRQISALQRASEKNAKR